jgi:hypothetical protein
MDKSQFLIETHLRTRRPIAELAAAHQVSRSLLYKLLKRYRLEGPVGSNRGRVAPRVRVAHEFAHAHRRPLRRRDRAAAKGAQ